MAAVAVAVAYALRLTLDPAIGAGTPFVVLYFLPVIVAAWRSGRGPAVLAGVLGVAVGDIVSIDPTNGVPWVARVVRVGTFMGEAVLIAWVLETHRQQKKAKRALDRRYRVLAEHFPKGMVLMVDRNLRYTLAAGPALASMGLRVEDVLDHTPTEVYPDERGRRTEARNRRALAGEAVEEETIALGGSFSAEHGIGLSKLPAMGRYKDPVAMEVMRTIKRALDPNGIMNPGKVLP